MTIARFLFSVTVTAAVVAPLGSNAIAQSLTTTRSYDRPHDRVYRWGTRYYTRELAEDLVRDANAVCVEMHRNYQGNPGFREVYREAYSLITESLHIQQLISSGYMRNPRANDDHIERDLRSLDRFFHHVESDIRRWRMDYRPNDRQNPQTLGRLMSNFDRTLHLIMTDYGVRDTSYDRIPGRPVQLPSYHRYPDRPVQLPNYDRYPGRPVQLPIQRPYPGSAVPYGRELDD